MGAAEGRKSLPDQLRGEPRRSRAKDEVQQDIDFNAESAPKPRRKAPEEPGANGGRQRAGARGAEALEHYPSQRANCAEMMIEQLGADAEGRAAPADGFEQVEDDGATAMDDGASLASTRPPSMLFPTAR